MRNQILPWFGSKAALGPQVLSELGPHKMYVEPFCGALGVLLQKAPCRNETVNDLHQDLTHLVRLLAQPASAAALVRRLDRMLCCEQLNREARQRLLEPFEPTLQRAVDWFYVAWMTRTGFVGSTGAITMAHCYTVNAGTCARKLRQASESIRAWSQRLRHVTILNRCAFKLLGQLRDEPGLVIYVDPPYVVKGGEYVHDLDRDGHVRLADALRRFRAARVVVSYTAHPLLEQLYQGWTTKVLDYESRANRGVKNPQVKPPEILLINGPLMTVPGPSAVTPSRRTRKSIDLAV